MRNSLFLARRAAASASALSARAPASMRRAASASSRRCKSPICAANGGAESGDAAKSSMPNHIQETKSCCPTRDGLRDKKHRPNNQAVKAQRHRTAERLHWDHLRQHHPRLQMNEPGSKGPGSNWIYMKGRKYPKGAYLRHKMDEHVMILCFARRNMDDLLNARTGWPEDIQLGQRGREAVHPVDVPPVDPFREFEPQRDAVEEALKAACRLQRYGRILEEAGPGA